MAESHPNDIELLEYVEGDLDEPAVASIRAHLAGCETCAAEVAQLERARLALHAAPLLELPMSRRDRILAGLPEQEREPRGGRALFTRRRLLTVLAPAAVGAAVAIAVVSTSGNGTGGDESAERAALEEAAPPAEPAPAEPAPAEPPAEAAEGAAAEEDSELAEPPPDTPAQAPAATEILEAAAALSVGGTPEDVVSRLRRAGLEVRIVGETVEVTDATRADVERLLEDLGPGPVEVTVLEPPG